MTSTHIYKMPVIALFIITLQALLINGNEEIVKMDKDGVNNCGRVYTLNPSHEVRVISSGMAPDGYCGITANTPKKYNNFTCDALCVTFKTASISTCDVKVKFVGHVFGKNGDLVREFSCHNSDRSSFCWNVNSIRVEVIESYDYAFKWNKALYEFNIDVSARCTKDSIARRIFHASREKVEEDERQTYIEGIAVGISLACVFLVILFVMWCYTKHQAVVRGRSDNNGNGKETAPAHANKAAKKGNLFTTFRAKLHIGRKHAQPNDDENQQQNPIYRKTSESKNAKSVEDPEAQSELAPLKVETKDADGDTYELASEIPLTENENTKDGGQDSPKDGGDDAKLSPPEVIIVPGTPEPPETP